MSIFDWLKGDKNKSDNGKQKQDADANRDDGLDDISDEELEEWMAEEGFNEPDEQSQKMYAFVHVAIRDAVMENHPELIEELDKAGEGPTSMPFLHFWSRAMMILENMGIIEMDDDEVDDEWLPFDEMSIEQKTIDGHRISVVTFPKPRFSPEAYMAAIVHEVDEPTPYDGERGSARYFTLEYGGEGIPPVFCEWDGEEHCNYGEGPQPDVSAFINIVREHL